MNEPTIIKIDDVEYVRKDQIKAMPEQDNSGDPETLTWVYLGDE